MARHLKFDPKNYDLLWKWGVPYLYISIYLESGYKKLDCISYNEGDINYFFISKKERERLSRRGYILYTSRFNQWRKRVEEKFTTIRKYIREEKGRDPQRQTTEQLLKNFERMVSFLRAAWQAYLPTEIHTTDLVARRALEGPPGQIRDRLRRNLKIAGSFRLRCRETINQIMYTPGAYYKYTAEITRRLKNKKISHYDYSQVLNLLEGKNIAAPFSKQIILGKFTGWRPLMGPPANELFRQLLPPKRGTNLISGTAASRGFYRGFVRKIEFDINTDFQEEIRRMKKGEVLVSGSTGPEMILACKKAGAIVTEEGGILSHAAVVSRELSIPCVIGTKVATRLLKTGDYVEVDAINGLVKKLPSPKK